MHGSFVAFDTVLCNYWAIVNNNLQPATITWNHFIVELHVLAGYLSQANWPKCLKVMQQHGVFGKPQQQPQQQPHYNWIGLFTTSSCQCYNHDNITSLCQLLEPGWCGCWWSDSHRVKPRVNNKRGECLTLYRPVIDDCVEVKWLPFHVT